MKALLLVLSLIFTFSAFTQEFQEGFNESETKLIHEKLLKESDNPEHSEVERTFFAKVADRLINVSEKMTTTPMRRKVGKVAAAITTQTSRPFMFSSAFLTGLFEKKANEHAVAFLNFFLINESEFRNLPKQAATMEELSDLIYDQVDVIVQNKQNIILTDILTQIGATIKDPMDLSSMEVTLEQLEKITPAMINEHPEFQDLRPLVGDFTLEDVEVLMEEGEFNLELDLAEIAKSANIKIHEIVLTSISQVFLSAKVIGIVSGTLGTIYGVTVAAADVITGLSVTACVVNQNVQKKLTEDKDEDIRNFCSYVAVQSAYTLARSRARGYVNGKKFRVKMINTVDKFKNKLKKNKKTEQVM